MPLYGSKYFNITLTSAEAATHLATAGFDYETTIKPLRLHGPCGIHVSVFVSVEFPDEHLISLLKQYGQLMSDQLQGLYFTEGFTHIEGGIRMAEFILLDKDLPRKVIMQGLEMSIKYTGQPITCYGCGSTEHLVKECLKQRHPQPACAAPGGKACLQPSTPHPYKPLW